MLPGLFASLAMLAEIERGTANASADCIVATSLSPMSAMGESVTLTASYTHCEGPAAFRIVQLWIGEEVTPEAVRVSLSYEAGVFALESASTCMAGEAKILNGPYADFDCATATATPVGNDLVMRWPLAFDAAAFPGEHRLFVDARGGTGNPEPRLGWTEMGTFTVPAPSTDETGSSSGGDVDTGAVSTGSTESSSGGPMPGSDDGAIDVTGGVGASPRDNTGCGCSSPTGAPSPAAMLALLAWAVRPRRRA